MIQIARTWRFFAGGMAAGFVGVVIIASGKASAEPLFPQPPVPAPAPAQPAAPPVQNLTVVPGGVNSNRFAPAPAQAPVQAPAAVASPIPATVPATGTAPAVAAPMPPSVTPVITGTLREFLQGKGVKLEAQKPQGFKALDITLPMPARWTPVPDPNVPDAFAVIADRLGKSLYTSNAQVVVYKLVGDFDPAEAITHGFVDSQRLLAWQTTNASMANLGSFPSSVIEGQYRENDMTLNTSRRHVLATAGADKYLVSLTVTTALSQAIGDGPATNAIINGFRVSAPGQTPARAGASTTPAPQAPARVTAPAAPAQVPAQAPAPATRPAPAAVPAPAAAPAQLPTSGLNPAPQSVPGVTAALPPLVTVAPVPSR